MENTVKNKVIVLTGGLGLLGQALSKSILKHGAYLVIGDLEKDTNQFIKSLENTYGDSFLYLHLDVSSDSSVSKFFLETKKIFNKIDVLINAAAINPKVSSNGLDFSGSIDEISKYQFIKEIEVGLYGSFLCSKYFGNQMAASGGGNIINIASDLSIISPDHRLYSKDGDKNKLFKPITYSIIKHGLVGLTKYFATYWPAEKKIRCNSISPGGIYDNQDPEFVAKLSSLIPLGRMATKDEYSDLVLFLCSDGSSYINGHNLVADGGRSVW